MLPIIKWPGGKDRELKYIIPALPPRYNDFYDPFVGGGSVFAALPGQHYFVNDFSEELISLYRAIADDDEAFYVYARHIDEAWSNADRFFENAQELIALYISYRDNHIEEDAFVEAIVGYCAGHRADIERILSEDLSVAPDVLFHEIEKNLKRKMLRMRDLEIKKHSLPEADIYDNVRTAIKSALYMYFRHLYNEGQGGAFQTALFMFIRNYCYSAMFRYSSDGNFNVPYGGMAYNNKRLDRKLDCYRSREVRDRMRMTTLSNLDFEDFFEAHQPTADDFVFLDPPYDSEFSTYAQNEFTRADQLRLANYLVNRCRANWMLVIKNTDFISHLYNHPGINIRAFNKAYQVSFMNRNDRSVEHLLITNY